MAFTTTPPKCSVLLSGTELVRLRYRYCTCVLVSACNCNSRTKPDPYFVCMERGCLTEESISWKSFSSHYGVGHMWCWFEWKIAGSSVSSHVLLGCNLMLLFLRIPMSSIYVRWFYHCYNVSHVFFLFILMCEAMTKICCWHWLLPDSFGFSSTFLPELICCAQLGVASMMLAILPGAETCDWKFSQTPFHLFTASSAFLWAIWHLCRCVPWNWRVPKSFKWAHQNSIIAS